MVILDVGNKLKRNKVDIKSKWIVDEVRGDYLFKLQDQISSAFGEKYEKILFSKDFNKHVKCIHEFKQQMESDNFFDVLDLIIKWAFIKSIES